MVIQHNIMALNSHRQLGINNTNLSKNLEKLSSGYRVNRAADDAAGLAISEKMRAQITGLNRAVMNAQDGISFIQTAEGALAEVHDMLNRMVDLATEAANGIMDSVVDRANIQSEIDSLNAEITRIATHSNFNGTKMLDGSLASLQLQIGDTSAETITIGIGSMNASALSVNSVSVDTVSNANTAISAIKTAINTVSKTRGDLGALQNRLEHTINNLGVMAENMTQAESRIRDVDMAKEMMAFTKNSVLSQAAQAMLAQANMQPQNVLQLLR